MTATRLVVFLVCVATPLFAVPPTESGLADHYHTSHFSDASLQKLFADVLEPVKSVRELPPAIVAQLGKIAGEENLQLAEPGAAYNATDAILDPKLPYRQLRFAGKVGSFFLICYDRGGSRSSECAVIFALDSQGRPNPIWAAVVLARCNTLAELRDAYTRHNVVEYPLAFGIF